MAVKMFEVVNEITPAAMVARFSLVRDVSDGVIHAASMGDLHMPLCRLQSIKHNFYIHGVMVWNAIPFEARQSTSIKQFKLWLELLF